MFRAGQAGTAERERPPPNLETCCSSFKIPFLPTFRLTPGEFWDLEESDSFPVTSCASLGQAAQAAPLMAPELPLDLSHVWVSGKLGPPKCHFPLIDLSFWGIVGSLSVTGSIRRPLWHLEKGEFLRAFLPENKNTGAALCSPSLATPGTFLEWVLKISPYSFSCCKFFQIQPHALLSKVQPQDKDAKTLLLFIWCCKHSHFIAYDLCINNFLHKQYSLSVISAFTYARGFRGPGKPMIAGPPVDGYSKNKMLISSRISVSLMYRHPLGLISLHIGTALPWDCNGDRWMLFKSRYTSPLCAVGIWRGWRARSAFCKKALSDIPWAARAADTDLPPTT